MLGPFFAVSTSLASDDDHSVVVIEQNFRQPPEIVFDYFVVPLMLEEWNSPAEITLIEPGEDPREPYGFGAVRRVKAPILGTFDENIVQFQRPHLISYYFDKSRIARNTWGSVNLIPQEDRWTHVKWTIEYQSQIGRAHV